MNQDMTDNPYKILIGLHGPIGSGKSTLAGALTTGSRSVVLPFAKKVKDIAYEMGWDGRKDAWGRRLLQLLGTECGRQCIREDIWVRHWEQQLSGLWERGAVVVVADDVRFQNELDAIRRQGGMLIKLKGRRSGRVDSDQEQEADAHASERDFPDQLFDLTYRNTGDIDSVYTFAEQLLRNRTLQIASETGEYEDMADLMRSVGLN